MTKNNPLLWVLGACGVGVLLGSIFFGRVETALIYVGQTIAYRPFLFMVIVLVGIGAYGWISHAEKQEAARMKTKLIDDELHRIKAQVKHDLATRKHEINRLETKMNANRDRLRDMTVRVITDTDKLHKELVEFVWFVDHVNELLDRRSKKLCDALPDNPVAIDEIRQRDEKMRTELNKVVEMIRNAFPSLADSIPSPRKPIQSSGQILDSDEAIEVLELKREAEKLAEYQAVSQPKGRAMKH
jgi:hypothetical protein